MDHYQCLRCGAEYEWQYEENHPVPQYCRECSSYLKGLERGLMQEKVDRAFLTNGLGGMHLVDEDWDYDEFVIECIEALRKKREHDRTEIGDPGTGEPDPGDEE